MRDIALLFSSPMAVATHAGRKTVTRRTRGLGRINEAPDVWECISMEGADFPAPAPGYFGFRRGSKFPDPDAEYAAIKSPYGVAGDRWWMRENYRVAAIYDTLPPRELPKGATVWYEADGPCPWAPAGKLRPGMFMCRWMSRDSGVIVSVRPERLHSITEADAIAEGIQRELLFPPSGYDPDNYFPPGAYGYVNGLHAFPAGKIHPKAVGAYAELWDHLNGDGSYNKNEWLWRVEYTREVAP